jgi:raffinose/stachyose/melibiose transport system substrate-binding protein
MTLLTTRHTLLAASAGVALSLAFALEASAQQTTLTLFAGADDQALLAYTEALAAAFEEQNPDTSIEIEIGPGGTERDNMVKSRLATGTMTDIFYYNAGSLFQAINPTESTVDLSNEPWQANVLDSFKQTVTATDGTVRGAPFGLAMGGGVLYNKPIYEELGLEVPMTWDEFMANSEKIKAAGKVPVIQSFGTTWTSQLFVLADYYNVQAAEPDFAERYTNNQAKYATSEAAMAGFQHQEDVFKAGYLNEDFAAATLDDALRMVAEGEGAHYPMLTFALGNIGQNYPEQLNEVGFFGIPGSDPEKNGATVWMPQGIYIAATSPNLERAKRFVAFAASVEACDIWKETSPVTGPFLIRGCELPAEVPAGVADMAVYFESDGRTAPALEFVSPIKGPNLENLTVEVGSGIRSAADAAALYDEDVKKQAQQLGLAGW